MLVLIKLLNLQKYQDGHMVLFAVDEAMVQLLDHNKTDDREKLLDYFLAGFV
ncbi:hypothetical protein [Acinetobacter oleivorans]|uniref:hypothetical protein n=1 Tax=Acinetobacter oleivorans TaxID=1148157 RepID=UPI003F5CE709